MWPEKPSFVASDNRDVFIPPVLSGLILDPRMNRRDPNPHETQRPISQSPTKQRQNPFNTEPEDAGEEPLTTSECTFHATNTDQDNASARLVDDYTQPVPKNSGVIISQHPQESQTQPGSPEGSQGNSATPRGILKFTSCSGSSAEEEAGGPVLRDPPHESPPAGDEDNLAGCLDRKQVRFRPAADQSSGQQQGGMGPPGMHILLDVDLVSAAEDNGDSLVNSSSATADMRRPLVKQTDMRRPLVKQTDMRRPLVKQTDMRRPLVKQTDMRRSLVKQTRVDVGICGPQHAPSDKYEHGHAELLGLQASIHSAEHESGFKNESSPSRGALKRMSSRPMSLSKSLENLSSQTTTTREEKSKTSPTGQMGLLSVDDDPEQIKKMSTSVPALQEEEIDSDSTFDVNMGRKRITISSTSMSQSSGMVSMSSVSGSMSSLYPADLGNVEVRGSIQFAVNYVQKLAEFHIFVVHCRDLAVADPKKNRSDPYVKCYLLPDQAKLGKRKTSVKKKTLNPTYNEILRFKIAMETLKTLKLSVSVWHNDTFGVNSFLGEVDLDLSEWDFSNTQMNDYFLKSRLSAPSTSRSNSVDMRGQMRVALRFLPQTSHSKRTTKMETGEVQIWVKDCKNLPAVRGMSIDPFVKCTVLPDTSRKVIQKTRVVKRSASPMFNHTMVYDGLRPEDLREACAEITVWDQDKLTTHYIGGLRLGLGTGKSYGLEAAWMDSTTEESNLWERMMQSNGDWVESVLSLRTLVLAKSMSK